MSLSQSPKSHQKEESIPFLYGWLKKCTKIARGQKSRCSQNSRPAKTGVFKDNEPRRKKALP